jgi:release factor glutamine methyltransferase
LPETVLALRDAVAWATDALARAGCDTPRLDAELLLAFALGCDRAALVTGGRDQLPAAAVDRFEQLVARREAREPVAYITGVRAFRRIELAVDRRVLIPRPETEVLVDAGVALIGRGARVVDVGIGSGAVALALKDERPDLTVVGTDLSADALAVARANASRLGLDVSFAQADLFEGQFDAVVANLPYVADGCPELAPEITSYEPAAALYGGADGLDVIRRLIAALDGVELVALEVGFDQASVVSGLLSEAGFGSVERRRDLAGHERVVVGRR